MLRRCALRAHPVMECQGPDQACRSIAAAARRRGRKALKPPDSMTTTNASSTQQCKRGEEDRSAQIERLAVPIDVEARIERRNIQRSRAVRWRQCIDRDKAFRRAIKAWRMIEAAASGKVARDGTRGRRRRSEGAETIKHACRGNDLSGPPICVFGGRIVAVGGHGCAGERHEPPKHIDESARQWQIRPAAVGRHMEQHDQSLAAALGGHQRRAVSQRRPGPVVELRVRFGQHLAGDGDIGRNRHSIEWAFAREAGELLRFVPTQAAAQDPAATPQFHRHQIVVGHERDAAQQNEPAPRHCRSTCSGDRAHR